MTESEQLETPKREARKWTSKEDLYVRANIGKLATEEMATYLGRTNGAVNHRYQSLGLDFNNVEGTMTAQMLSEASGVPLTTLIDWLRKGQYPGIKVGKVWRIEWNGEDPVGPSWHGKALLKDQLDKEKNRKTCLSCGNFLLTYEDYWCSKKCRGETMGAANFREINGFEEPGIEFPPPFRPNFLNWLAFDEVGILKRTKIITSKGGGLMLENGHILTDEEKALQDAVLNYPGGLVPYSFLGSFEAQTAAAELKSKLRVPEDFFDVGFAGAVGVSEFPLSLDQTVVMRQLWQKEGVAVSASYLSRNITRVNTSPQKREDTERVVEVADSLRPFLRNSYGIEINSTRQDRGRWVTLKGNHK